MTNLEIDTELFGKCNIWILLESNDNWPQSPSHIVTMVTKYKGLLEKKLWANFEISCLKGLFAMHIAKMIFRVWKWPSQ